MPLRFFRSWLFLLIFTVNISAQTAAPETPAGRVLAAWLAALNSADLTTMRDFDGSYRLQSPLAQVGPALRRQTGGFTLVQIEKNEPLSVVALIREKDGDGVARVEFSVTADQPPTILRHTLERVPPPRDLAVARLTEEQALTALVSQAQQLTDADRFSGAVLVARRDKLLLEKGWGRADRTTGRLVTPDSKFSIGSMNKMFTAVAVLQLVEAKKIVLDDPIGKYLTDYPNRDAATKVTVRHLLTHTGHTGDFFGPEFVANRLSLKEPADYVKLFGSQALTGEPGSGFEYSNFGFILLGAIIEKATGQSYYDYVRTNIFQPAGMKATDSLPETDNVPDRASGYRRDGSAWVSNVDTLPYRGTSAGGGYSTVGDLLRFVQALESGRLLSKTMFGEATNPQGGRYGYGFGADGEGALRSYGHNGGAPGMNGDLRVFPQLGYVVVALSNLDPPAASRLVDYFVARMPATP